MRRAPKYLLGLYEVASLDIILGCGQGSVERRAIIRVEPVSWIERQESNLGACKSVGSSRMNLPL